MMTMIWVGLACFLVALPSSQVGTFLVLRRMSLMGDAISHSVLPGIVIAFLMTGSLGSPWLIVGAGLAGLGVTFLVEMIHTRSRIKQDAAIGISFTSLFALGVLLMNSYAQRVDLDPGCVLYGQLEFLVFGEEVMVFHQAVPKALLILAGVCFFVVAGIVSCYRLLLVTSFDGGLASSYQYRPVVVHFVLMGLTSLVVVAAFQAVGAILVIALLILPGAFACLCAKKLPLVLMLAALHALLSTLGGMYLSMKFSMQIAPCVVLAGFGLFVLAWLFGPFDGVLVKWALRNCIREHKGEESLERKKDDPNEVVLEMKIKKQ